MSRPPDATDTSLTLEQITVGQQLPEQEIDVSVKTVISTAIASRDYQDVHHDVEKARERGTRTIFMNILSSNGFVLRYVTDWAGPEAIVRASRIRLGVPNYAGETMHLTGSVIRVEPVDDPAGAGTGPTEGLVEIEVTGANSLGNHVTATVQITVPAGGAR